MLLNDLSAVSKNEFSSNFDKSTQSCVTTPSPLNDVTDHMMLARQVVLLQLSYPMITT